MINFLPLLLKTSHGLREELFQKEEEEEDIVDVSFRLSRSPHSTLYPDHKEAAIDCRLFLCSFGEESVRCF